MPISPAARHRTKIVDSLWAEHGRELPKNSQDEEGGDVGFKQGRYLIASKFIRSASQPHIVHKQYCLQTASVRIDVDLLAVV
jgi:hypothetical protein